MVKKFKPFETARVSWRNRRACLALWAGNEPYNPRFCRTTQTGDSLWIGRRILAYITGTVDQELLPRNEYLVAENRILRDQVNGRLLLSDCDER
jgi:hypothetical protein